jgi:hypothetical protein
VFFLIIGGEMTGPHFPILLSAAELADWNLDKYVQSQPNGSAD